MLDKGSTVCKEIGHMLTKSDKGREGAKTVVLVILTLLLSAMVADCEVDKFVMFMLSSESPNGGICRRM